MLLTYKGAEYTLIFVKGKKMEHNKEWLIWRKMEPRMDEKDPVPPWLTFEAHDGIISVPNSLGSFATSSAAIVCITSLIG